ncbi:unnamed protein product [Blepharisma stoltei]|uniref:Uncharacterized protein n=1 Tax=Blepharisma stoltei TaxID=1481888 RepID=A0AAU9K905_9CILI|nr:unnamed protein product [Blepharisma stoltei]
MPKRKRLKNYMEVLLNSIGSKDYEDFAAWSVIKRVKKNIIASLGGNFVKIVKNKENKGNGKEKKKGVIELEPVICDVESEEEINEKSDDDFFEEIKHEIKEKKKEKAKSMIESKPREKKKVVFTSENEKYQYAADFAKKLLKERAKKLKEKEEQKLKEIKEEEKEYEESLWQQQLEMDRINLAKRKRVDELVVKREQRKLNLFKAKTEMKSLSKEKPLYKKIEDEYEEKVVRPEMERRKTVLIKKREIYSPVRHEEIENHIEKYQKYIDEKSKIKSQSASRGESPTTYSSKFMSDVIENDRKEREKQEYMSLEKKLLANKRIEYGKIVIEHFPPIIDKQKKQELEESIKRIDKKREILPKSQSLSHRAPVIRRSKTTMKRHSRISSESDSSSSQLSIMQESSSFRPTRRNYLEDQKRLREIEAKELLENSYKSFESLEKPTDIHKYAKNLERKAKRHESLLKSLSPLSTIEAEDNVNFMILESIKSKLSMLL